MSYQQEKVIVWSQTGSKNLEYRDLMYSNPARNKNNSSPVVFILNINGWFFIFVIWVDDIPGFYKVEDDYKWVVSALSEKYKVKDEDEGKLSFILGVEVET